MNIVKEKNGEQKRKEHLTQRLNVFGIPPCWFSEGSCVIDVYTQAVVEVGPAGVEVPISVTYGSLHTILCARPRVGGRCFHGHSGSVLPCHFPLLRG